MKYFIALLLLGSLSLGVAANETIHERQKLIFFTADAYAVLSSERQSTPELSSGIVRSSIKTYHLETNELLSTSVLSEHRVDTDDETGATRVTDIRDATQPSSIVADAVDKILVEHAIEIRGDFDLDDQGIYFNGETTKKYVVPMKQMWNRLKWPVDQYSVVRMHREKTGELTRYFLILRSDDYGQQQAVRNEYEIVISLPENY